MSREDYSRDEKVLFYEKGKMYEATILNIQELMNQDHETVYKYYIHYTGWNKKWDEWVEDSCLLKYNDENLQLKKKIQQKFKLEESAKKGRKSDVKRASLTSTSRSRKIFSVKTDSTTKEPNESLDEDGITQKRQLLDTSVSNEDEENIGKTEIVIKIPEDLKKYLIDESHAINLQHKLIELPAKITCKEIVDKYKQHKKSKSGDNKGNSDLICDELSNTILEYFNVTLNSQLLYKAEQIQYHEITNKYPGKNLSEIYGTFHLLRLFVKLGPAISHTTLDNNTIRGLIDHIEDFLKFLESEQKELFNMNDFKTI